MAVAYRQRYVYTYQEPDTSAWKRKRVCLDDGRIVYRLPRPVLEGAFEDLERGLAPNGARTDGLIVPDPDRLTRDNRHFEDAIEVVEKFGRPIIDKNDCGAPLRAMKAPKRAKKPADFFYCTLVAVLVSPATGRNRPVRERLNPVYRDGS
ncbi:hypothetical protein ABZW30_33220 [Kitasatospora sp. NPDC004669]|uniref:hypothetical protein n=1 Tax=Kitasatospora sp. NPDC004669 TaxID=3154555 RepID=UPI0033A1234B